MRDGQVASYCVLPAGGEITAVVAEQALRQAAETAGISVGDVSDIGFIAATGSGRKSVPFAKQKTPELACLAKATGWLFPSGKTVIDIGAEKCLALQISGGRTLNFALNDKCAAGSGAFLETVADMLHLPLDDIGPLSLRSQEALEIKNTCVVFAESEIISLIHAKKAREDILRGVFEGLALSIYSLMTRIGVEQDVVMVGGVAKNIGMVKALEKHVGLDIIVPDNPEIAGALGAALVAIEKGETKT
jgi:predicted CoA-substrate-specific enzyme activase